MDDIGDGRLGIPHRRQRLRRLFSVLAPGKHRFGSITGITMIINLVPDDSVASAPDGFTAAVQAAADVFDQDFPGDYTVNISYGWGTYDNEPYAPLTNPNSGDFSVGGSVNSTFATYSQLKGWLTADAVSNDQIAAVDSLPASNSAFPGHANSFYVSSAQEKALGVYTGNSSTIDGSIGFNVGDTSDSYYWETGALVEIAHALGWDTDYYTGAPTIADLFRYKSAGKYQWTGGKSAYFSIDGGNTALAQFSTTFDYTLFSNVADNDPFNVAGDSIPAQALTSLDTEVLNVIGFDVTPTVSISVNNTDLNLADDMATVTFAFSAAPAAFSLSDATAVGGTLSNLQQVDTTDYTAIFTAASNTDIANAVVSVTANSWQDSNSDLGAAGSTTAFTVDTLDHWIKSSSANWSKVADWGNAVPTASVGADVDASGTYKLSITSADAAYGLTLNDAGATVSDNSGGTLTLDGTGGSTSPNGVLNINAGTFKLNGGALQAGSILIANSAGLLASLGAYSGSSAISEAIVDNGSITFRDGSPVTLSGDISGSGSVIVNKGSVTFTGAVTGSEIVTVYNTAHAVFDTPIAGTGSFDLMNGGNLEFGAADSENVTFAAGSTGTLKIDHSLTAPFTGTIAGLTPSNKVDLADLTWVKGHMHATYSGNTVGGVLTVTDGSQSVELDLSGNYTTSAWALSNDGGGTKLVDHQLGADAADKLILDSASSFNGMIDNFFTEGDAIANAFAESARTLLSEQMGADNWSWTRGAGAAVPNLAAEPYVKSMSADHGAGSGIRFV